MASRLRSELNAVKSVFSVDASGNGSINGILNSNKRYFEDKWPIPYPIGPYHVDAIPMQIKDKFKMSKYSLNQDTDVSGGLAIEANGIKSVLEFDTPSVLDVIVYVPSSRNNRIMSEVFKQDDDTKVNSTSNLNMPLIDFALAYGNSDYFGDALWAKINAFKLNCETTTDPSGLRPGLLNAILTDPEYQLIKNNLKYPWKIWDMSSNATNFLYENLIDLSGNAMKNILVDSTKYSTKVTRSTWEDQGVDSSGIPLR